jgi:hypothetical protein
MKTTSLILGLIGFALCAGGQGFLNSNFENAIVQIHDPTYGFLDWNLAVPGWTHSNGSDTSIVYYRSEHLGVSQYYLLMDSTSPFYAPGTQLAGNYSLAFASGYTNSSGMPGASDNPWVNAFIAQTGLVPTNAQSLRMLATGPFRVLVGGVEVPMVSLGGNAYGGNMSGFAGTLAELRIMNISPVGNVHNPTIVDNILFSSSPVPEPTFLSLVAVGVVSLYLTRRRRTGR